jgi:hypothetical protein
LAIPDKVWGDALEAWGRAFEASGKTFLARGKVFETRDNEARFALIQARNAPILVGFIADETCSGMGEVG